ncbi:hypothetical protein [Prosthecobacter sp.]|uniref:hypothetical protein n=1 Tax=Prosthecobacter sp. TaxID=1965333 RepID=UPI0025F5F675|nr:hypothetical protein [Prosthecobacter sp.]
MLTHFLKHHGGNLFNEVVIIKVKKTHRSEKKSIQHFISDVAWFARRDSTASALVLPWMSVASDRSWWQVKRADTTRSLSARI